MSSIIGKRNHTIYRTQINNSVSIGADQTLVPVLVKNISRDTTKTGKRVGTPFFKIVAVCMSKEPTFIKKRAKKTENENPENGQKKQKVVEVEQKTEEQSIEGEVVDGDTEEEQQTEVDDGEYKGTTVTAGDEFLVTTYDPSAGSLTGGVMVKLALTADLYKGRSTFQAGKVMVEKNSNILCDKNYDACVADTKLGEIPTIHNMSEEDFPEGTIDKFMNRTFILPLSVENSKFSNVELQVEDETSRFFCKIQGLKTEFVGLSTQDGDMTLNMFKAVYTPKEEGMPKTMMTFAYKPKMTEGERPVLINPWDCFGFANQELWDATGFRFLFNAKEWYVYGFSNLRQLERIMAVKDNDEPTDEEEPFEYSTGFITRMSVNLKDTVKTIGIPLSTGFIEQHFGSDSDYSSELEFETHPLNSGWKVSVKRNKPFLVNFTDLSADQTEQFLKEAKKSGCNVKYYGIFKDDKAYEMVAETPEEREDKLLNEEMKPDVVFAVNE